MKAPNSNANPGPSEKPRQESSAIEQMLQRRVESYLRGSSTSAGISSSLEYSGPPARIPIPVRIWLESEEGSEEVESGVKRVLDAFGFTIVKRNRAKRGSWIRSFVFRLRRAGSSPEVRSRLEKLERAIELQVLTKTQAEVDKAQAEAVSGLLSSLQGTPNALIQIGSVLLIKRDNVPIVRNLTQREILFLERRPGLLNDPGCILQALDAESGAQLPLAGDG